ncbi:MAG: AMP-binding protein [Syntrophaceae bacterium]|nr:AMP-binding protein [Syntrophaceae bacterium]
MQRNWEQNWPKQDPLVPPLPTEPIFELIRKQAKIRPDKTAILFYGHETTFQELDDATDRLATALVNMGLGKGDRIGLYFENCPQFVIGFYGILKMGGIVVNVSPMYKQDELVHELKDAGVETIIMEDFFWPVLEPVIGECGLKNILVTSFADYLPEKPTIPLHASMSTEKKSIPGTIDFKSLIEKTPANPPKVEIDLENDVALLQYTAGTTGSPKGAMLTHGNMAVHNLAVRHYYEYTENDVHLIILPLFHITGLDIAMNPALAVGSTLILFARFDLLPMLDVIQKYKVTGWVTITPINVAVCNLPIIGNYDLKSLRFVLSGGAPVPLEIHKRWKELTGTHIVEGYGLSECTGGIVGNNCQNFSPGTIGSPVFWHDVKIVHPATPDKEAGIGEEGELWIKGPCVMKGYWNAPEQTKNTITPDGYLMTGDMVTVDKDGWFRIVGRAKEMIKVSGFSVFLAEIDAFLYQHPAVAEAAAIGVPHPYRGEEPKAYVVLKPDFKGKVTEQEIIDWCKDKMAAYKVPASIAFTDGLPKSGAGKVLRRLLAEQEKK